MTLRDYEVCMCKYHENIDLLLHTLTSTRLVSSHHKTAEHLLNATVCSQEESKCMDRECSDCGADQVVDELFDTDNELPDSYCQWRTAADGRVKKLLVVDVVGAKDLKAQLAPFGRHVYNVCRQFQELRHLKDCLPAGEIIHEDFAANFQLKRKCGQKSNIFKIWWQQPKNRLGSYSQVSTTKADCSPEIVALLP
ncbi:hypothetical protein AWC38_SpisGene12018 [Stylophora pistillata]|uniref:Uncharacterized protein n=1 Tax=Stylophora pistillata TaxID=50429 RepID=A0A2B4S3W0_STYPI|nr:hypothetical protein AWC38_SpisGene12018 [Stylophora pistillata]